MNTSASSYFTFLLINLFFVQIISMKIVAISGSTRLASCNSGLIRCAQSLVPAGIEIIQANTNLPLFSQDLEVSPPTSVIDFHNLLKSADAILIASPEHNYCMSAVTKNAIDWGTRQFVGGEGPTNLYFDKPCAIMSAGGMSGGTLGQHTIRQSLVYSNVHFLNKPEVMVQIWGAEPAFDPVTGDVINQKVKDKVKALVNALVLWTTRVSANKEAKV